MIALDPEQTWRVGFDIEAAKPDAARRWLVVRFATARQYERIKDLGRQADGDDADVKKRLELLGQALEICAVRWEGVAGESTFARDRLADLLSIDDHWELWQKFLNEQRATEVERKKSVLRSVSATAGTSAPAAPNASA